MKRFCFAIALAAALSISTAIAAPSSFFHDLTGIWSGSGHAYLANLGELSANCQLSISGAETQMAMEGSCEFLVFRQALGLIVKDAGGNKYIGTYTGSKTGPAALEGALLDDRLVMNITWGGLVNGDRKAQMILERTGPNSFTLTVLDIVEGKTRSTSSFAFKRQ